VELRDIVVFLCFCGTTSFALSVQDVEKIAQNAQQNSVEGFLASLKEQQPDLARDLSQNFTLMKASGSSQDASCKDPRVLSYNKDASVVMSFNGGPGAYHANSEGGENVEMMLFDEKEKIFKVVDVDLSQKPPVVTANPSQCMSCHSDRAGNVMPIWNQFPNWHNAYGAFLDRLSPEEAKSLNELKEKAKSHPRYSFLDFDSKHPNFPYELPQSLDDSNGNVRLTQQLNERYVDFLNGHANRNYADDPKLALNLKRGLVLEDKCKLLVDLYFKSPKGNPAKSEIDAATELRQLLRRADSATEKNLAQMRPPLNANELSQVTDKKISQRQLLFRAVTGLGLKGRGLATMRPASKEDPGGSDACLTSARPKTQVALPSDVITGNPAESNANLNPLFLLKLPNEVLGREMSPESGFGFAECRRIALDLLGQSTPINEVRPSDHQLR